LLPWPPAARKDPATHHLERKPHSCTFPYGAVALNGRPSEAERQRGWLHVTVEGRLSIVANGALLVPPCRHSPRSIYFSLAFVLSVFVRNAPNARLAQVWRFERNLFLKLVHGAPLLASQRMRSYVEKKLLSRTAHFSESLRGATMAASLIQRSSHHRVSRKRPGLTWRVVFRLYPPFQQSWTRRSLLEALPGSASSDDRQS